MKILAEVYRDFNVNEEISKIVATDPEIKMTEVFVALAQKFGHLEFVMMDDNKAICAWYTPDGFKNIKTTVFD